MKFSQFLNEAMASAAAIAEIESIELLAEDDGFELLVYFVDQDITEERAKHIAGAFDFPHDADQSFLKPELPKDRAAYNVSVDEDGYKYYDKAKAFAKEHRITIEDDSDDRDKSHINEAIDISATTLLRSLTRIENDVAQKLRKVKTAEFNEDGESSVRSEIEAAGVGPSNKVAGIYAGYFDDQFGKFFVAHAVVGSEDGRAYELTKLKLDRNRFDDIEAAKKYLVSKGYELQK